MSVPQDCDCLQVYGWSEGELENPPVVNRIPVYLSGSVLSLSCSNLTLRQADEDNLDRVTKEAINWYVDDLLKSVATQQEATTQLHSYCGNISLEGASCVSWCVESFVIESGIIPGSLLPTRKIYCPQIWRYKCVTYHLTSV